MELSGQPTHSVTQQYWLKSPTGTEFTPLLSAIYARALIGISRALFNILSVPLDQGASLQRAKHAAQLIRCRLILDMDALGDAVKIEARMNIIKAIVELVCMDGAREPAQWGLSLLHMWYRGSSVWKSYLNSTLQDLVNVQLFIFYLLVDSCQFIPWSRYPMAPGQKSSLILRL